MKRLFEDFLRWKFIGSEEDKIGYNDWIYSLPRHKIIEYAKQWAKESETVKDDLNIHKMWKFVDKEYGWTSVMKEETTREIMWTILNHVCAKFSTPPPIEPAKARKGLDCLARYRTALEEIIKTRNNIHMDGSVGKCTDMWKIAEQALQPPQETKEG